MPRGRIVTLPCSPSTLTAGELHDSRRVHAGAGQQLLSEISHLRMASQREVRSQGVLHQLQQRCSLSTSAEGELTSSVRRQAEEVGFLHDQEIRPWEC